MCVEPSEGGLIEVIEQRKAVFFGHFDVEKNEVYAVLIDEFHGRFYIGGFINQI